MKRRLDRLPGKFITGIFLLAVIAFLGFLFYTGLIPEKYLILGGGVLLLFTILIGYLVWKLHHTIRFFMGTLLAIVLTAVMAVASVYLYRTTSTLNAISGIRTEVANVAVYVRAEDSAQSVNDAADYRFGFLQNLDRENAVKVLGELEDELDIHLSTLEFEGLTQLASGLKNDEVQAIVLNQAYLDILTEMEGYESFASDIREISVKKIEQKSEEKEVIHAEKTTSGKNQGMLFTIYISGIDTRENVIANSRSDVNILACVNTATRQVLLLSTPRDYFIPLSISGGVPDKLTHAGIYGVDVSKDTLAMLYDTTINYYFRINFSGFEAIIDALGGIEVNSDYEFDSMNIQGYHFNQGINHLNGEEALIFSRERYAFSEGDRQRGRNQMAVITGVIKKALSPDLLKNYSSVMAGIEGSFETDMPYSIISSLVKEQLSQGGDWNVVSYSVDGTGDTQVPYSMSVGAYVMVPDYATVDKAKELIAQVYNNEQIKLD